jgi:hypothetical protein
MRGDEGRCGHKHSYPTRRVADKARHASERREQTTFRVYWCPAGHYHMTSSEAYQNPVHYRRSPQ